MSNDQTEHRKKTRQMRSDNRPDGIPESGEISYNLREEERPDGLKVRFKIKIETGQKARDLDARQAEAIRRLLQWAQHNHPQDRPGRD